MANWMIYGAAGYTGRLIAEEAHRRGWNPVLAGRGENVAQLAKRLKMRSVRFALDDERELHKALEGFALVLNCAGPFSFTCRPLFRACLERGAHYVDISGEIDSLEYILSQSEALLKKNLLAVPGMGFDVVPTDCVARLLSERAPGATELRLAYKASALQLSRGTYRSMLEGAASGGKVRKEGKIVDVSFASKTRRIAFDGDEELAALIPWGDVATAFHSTNIGNIEVYTAMSRTEIVALRAMALLARSKGARAVAGKLIGSLRAGPTDEFHASGMNWVWGEVENSQGHGARLTVETPEGYRFTAHSTLAGIQKILNDFKKRGALTPSLAFGGNFLFELPDVVKVTEETF